MKEEITRLNDEPTKFRKSSNLEQTYPAISDLSQKKNTILG
jgi:hypothetical protein